MAEIITPPIESLKKLRSYVKKRHEKSDCYTWEKILFRKDFQSWALTHRLHFEFPLHAHAGATTETDIRLLGKTVELAARSIRLWFQLHKGWEIVFQTFLENNIVTLPEDFYEVKDNKTKAITFEQCSELSSTPQGKLMKYDGVILSDYGYRIQENNLLLELAPNLTQKEFSKLWKQIKDFQSKDSLTIKNNRSRTEYPFVILNFIKCRKDEKTPSKQIIQLLREKKNFSRSGMDESTIDKLYKVASEMGF